MTRIIYLLLTIALLSSSCSQSSFEQEKADIDSLVIAYQKLTLNIKEIAVEEVKDHLKTYKESIDLIKKKTNPKKMPSMESAKFIDAFRSIKKTFKKLPKKQKELQRKININTKQLENLILDINNDLLSNEELEKIITQENEMFNEINRNYLKITKEIQKEKTNLDSLLKILPTEIEKLK